MKYRRLRPGETVAVRGFESILTTLDDKGVLDGLPFQPEMRKFCGRTFRVVRRVDKLIVEGTQAGKRRLRDTVLLEGPACDGTSHGGCQRACFPLWKEAWLERVAAAKEPDWREGVAPTAPTADDRPFAAVDGECQSSALVRATSRLPAWHPRRYLLDMTSGQYSLRGYLAYLARAIARKLQRLRRKLRRKPAGPAGRTPSDSLRLQPGEWVEVRTRAEIRATLDASGKNRGLGFTHDMWDFCGRRFRVSHRLERMILEGTNEMRRLDNTVILEGAVCDGKDHGGCQRICHRFWRESWLKRVDQDRPG